MQKVRPSQTEPATKKKGVSPLTRKQQNLVTTNYSEAMNIAKQQASKILAGRKDYYARGIDVTGVAEEMLVIAASTWNPDHKAHNFLGYYTVCIANGLRHEYRRNERFARANFDAWTIREVHEIRMLENVSGGILEAEDRIAYEQLCKVVDDKLSKRVTTEDAMRTLAREQQLAQTAEKYGIPTHAVVYDEQKVKGAIRKSRELSESLRMILTEEELRETATCAGPMEKKF